MHQILLFSALALLILIYVIRNKSKSYKFKEYIIEKGEYSSGVHMDVMLHPHLMEFEVIFDVSAIYNIGSDQSDINNIMGLSGFNDLHRDDSCRIGWRWFNDELQIMSYVYRNRERYSELIKVCEINKIIKCSIELSDKFYTFRVDENILRTGRGDDFDNGVFRRLYPWMGGSVPATKQTIIRIREI